MNEKRTIKDYVFIGLKGMGMGAADVVPGVSGGTIAFISGIYEELLSSISNINLGLLKTLKKDGFKAAWKELNGNFLLALFVGIGVSALSLMNIVTWLLNNKPILLWSFFFGLVVASIIYVAKQITKWNLITVLLIVCGAILAYWISTLPPLVSEGDISPLYLFISGAIAICAMILPGISGSFILVVLGAYKIVIEGLKNFEIKIAALFFSGCVFGLLTFSRILKYLFNNYKNYTLAVLMGFIVGSLNKIWPWKKVLTYRINSHGKKVPFNELSVSPFSFEGDSQLTLAIILAIVGFGLILLLEKLAVKKH